MLQSTRLQGARHDLVSLNSKNYATTACHRHRWQINQKTGRESCWTHMHTWKLAWRNITLYCNEKTADFSKTYSRKIEYSHTKKKAYAYTAKNHFWVSKLKFQVQAIHFFLSFFPFIFISWRLITLQYCSGFCHTLTWISHGFTCVPHPNSPSHLPPHAIPLGFHSAPALSTCLMHPTWAGDLFHPR